MPGCAPYAAAQLLSPKRRPKQLQQGVLLTSKTVVVGFWDVFQVTINRINWWMFCFQATRSYFCSLGEVPLQETPHHHGTPHHLRSLPIGISQLPGESRHLIESSSQNCRAYSKLWWMKWMKMRKSQKYAKKPFKNVLNHRINAVTNSACEQKQQSCPKSEQPALTFSFALTGVSAWWMECNHEVFESIKESLLIKHISNSWTTSMGCFLSWPLHCISFLFLSTGITDGPLGFCSG